MESTKVAWAKQKIEKAIDQSGPYSHNICSMALLAVVEADGKEAANNLIEEYRLDALFGIQKVKA
jgi:hypothetical protein